MVSDESTWREIGCEDVIQGGPCSDLAASDLKPKVFVILGRPQRNGKARIKIYTYSRPDRLRNRK